MTKGKQSKKVEKPAQTGFVRIEVTPEGSVSVQSNINMPMELIGVLEAAKEVKMRQFFPIQIKLPPPIIPGNIQLPNGFKKG